MDITSLDDMVEADLDGDREGDLSIATDMVLALLPDKIGGDDEIGGDEEIKTEELLASLEDVVLPPQPAEPEPRDMVPIARAPDAPPANPQVTVVVQVKAVDSTDWRDLRGPLPGKELRLADLEHTSAKQLDCEFWLGQCANHYPNCDVRVFDWGIGQQNTVGNHFPKELPGAAAIRGAPRGEIGIETRLVFRISSSICEPINQHYTKFWRPSTNSRPRAPFGENENDPHPPQAQPQLNSNVDAEWQFVCVEVGFTGKVYNENSPNRSKFTRLFRDAYGRPQPAGNGACHPPLVVIRSRSQSQPRSQSQTLVFR